MKIVLLYARVTFVCFHMIVLNIGYFYFEYCYVVFVYSAIGRSLIPRYFRSMFEGGITDLYYVLKYCKESFQNTSIILDCEQAMMVTHHSKPVFTKVS